MDKHLTIDYNYEENDFEFTLAAQQYFYKKICILFGLQIYKVLVFNILIKLVR